MNIENLKRELRICFRARKSLNAGFWYRQECRKLIKLIRACN